MLECSYRDLRNQLGIAISLFVVGTSLFTNPSYAQGLPPFEMLVVGDSHISGQGLSEENKFYFLVKEWLQQEVFGANRKVNLKVKAHAGSRLTLHGDDIETLRKNGDDPGKSYEMEVNLSSPSIRAQIDTAREEYGDPRVVDLVMLSGCITDVLVANTVNPFYPEKKQRERIRRFCNQSMSELLEHTTDTFPNAVVVVVGYFPIASINSDLDEITRYFLTMVNYPPKFRFVFTNPLSKLVIRLLRKKMVKRSRLWLRESNREIRASIAKVNAGLDKPRVLFIESPITENNAFATKQPMLWGVDKRGEPDDETFGDRKPVCAKVFGSMKHTHYGRLSIRACELSSVAHLNVAGSRAYAKAIKDKLGATFHFALR